MAFMRYGVIKSSELKQQPSGGDI